jgi:CRP-like cAMP-binding protein
MLTSEDLLTLAKITVEQDFISGSSIVRQGDIIDNIYIIVHGQAEVIKKHSSKNASGTILLATLSEGEVIGFSNEGLFSDSGRHLATVNALTDLKVLRISMHDFNEILENIKNVNQITTEMSRKILLMNFLKKAAPFSHFENDEFSKLAHVMEKKLVKAGEVIFEQGDKGDHCYLIKSGQIEIFIEQDHKKVSLATLSAEQMFGEVAILTETSRNASAKALEDSELISLPKEELIQAVQKDFDFNRNLMQMMLERYRPSRAEGVIVHQRKTSDGENIITLKNPKLGKYFRLSEDGYFIWENLDGCKTLKDLTVLLYEKFAIFSPEYICRLLFELSASEFIDMPAAKYRHLQSDKKVPIWIRGMLGLRKIMEFQISINHFDGWLTRAYQKFFHIFYTKSALILMSLLIIFGLIAFVSFVDNAVALFNKTSNLWWLIPCIIIIDVVTIPLHELGHALTAKAFGYEVNRFGIGWFWVSPVAFADTSDMWLSSRGPRLAVNLAGIYVDAVIGGMAAIAAFFIGSTLPFLSVLLWLYALLAYYYIFKNLNPLLEFDGYYALMDLLDVPNLRTSSIMWLLYVLPKSFKQPSLFKQYIPQIIYWFSCILFIVLMIAIILFLQEYWLRGIIPENILGVSKDYFRWLLPILAVVASGFGIAAEVKYRLIREQNRL